MSSIGLTFSLSQKKTSKKSTDLRPISISNTDNRIIGCCVKKVAQPSLEDVVGPNQHAFLSERSIEDPIRRFNGKFYNALEEGNKYYVLLVDFAKAFDSVSTGGGRGERMVA